jgi:hypothetical protein
LEELEDPREEDGGDDAKEPRSEGVDRQVHIVDGRDNCADLVEGAGERESQYAN